MANNETPHGGVRSHAERPSFWPLTLAAFSALVILLSLGVWQLQRLSWKEGLIADIEMRRSAEPISVAAALKKQRSGEDIRYLRVRVQGRYLHGDERYFYAPDAKLGPGFDVYTPFQLAGSDGLIIIDRGFVPEALKAPDQRQAGQSTSEQEVNGLVRLPGRVGAFTPDNDPQKNLWFWRDFDAMTKHLSEAHADPKLGLFVDAETPAPGGWPRGGIREIAVSNRHFGYAMTWFGLALTLIAIYGALMWNRVRK